MRLSRRTRPTPWPWPSPTPRLPDRWGHWQYDGVSSFAAEQVYEGLIGYEGAHTDRFEPRIAVKVPSKANGLISKDGRDYTFPIRKGVLFHDGTPLTPEDVRYSLLRSILQDRDAGHAWMLLDAILAE